MKDNMTTIFERMELKKRIMEKKKVNNQRSRLLSEWNKTHKDIYKILVKQLTNEGDFLQKDYGEAPQPRHQ